MAGYSIWLSIRPDTPAGCCPGGNEDRIAREIITHSSGIVGRMGVGRKLLHRPSSPSHHLGPAEKELPGFAFTNLVQLSLTHARLRLGADRRLSDRTEAVLQPGLIRLPRGGAMSPRLVQQ